MSTTIEIKRNITESLSREFPQCPVLVQVSPEDIASLWVQVFCVPAEKEAAVEGLIDRLQDALAPEGEYMLLPMVNNLEITRQYYPEYMPREPAAAQVMKPVDLMLPNLSMSRWSSNSMPTYTSRECYAVSRQLKLLESNHDEDAMLQPVSEGASTAAANDNFALAA